ncbi:MAG: hypothetical protein RML36_15265 [Anaerolineae bacterium]|nr:hypothetical protein [Anaerolineae bacterium]
MALPLAPILYAAAIGGSMLLPYVVQGAKYWFYDRPKARREAEYAAELLRQASGEGQAAVPGGGLAASVAPQQQVPTMLQHLQQARGGGTPHQMATWRPQAQPWHPVGMPQQYLTAMALAPAAGYRPFGGPAQQVAYAGGPGWGGQGGWWSGQGGGWGGQGGWGGFAGPWPYQPAMMGGWGGLASGQPFQLAMASPLPALENTRGPSMVRSLLARNFQGQQQQPQLLLQPHQQRV